MSIQTEPFGTRSDGATKVRYTNTKTAPARCAEVSAIDVRRLSVCQSTPKRYENDYLAVIVPCVT